MLEPQPALFLLNLEQVEGLEPTDLGWPRPDSAQACTFPLSLLVSATAEVEEMRQACIFAISPCFLGRSSTSHNEAFFFLAGVFILPPFSSIRSCSPPTLEGRFFLTVVFNESYCKALCQKASSDLPRPFQNRFLQFLPETQSLSQTPLQTLSAHPAWHQD